MEKFNVVLKKSAVKQFYSLPSSIQERVKSSIVFYLQTVPFRADGKHIKKLLEGYRLRVGEYRIFYYIERNTIVITSIVRRTSKTYS